MKLRYPRCDHHVTGNYLKDSLNFMFLETRSSVNMVKYLHLIFSSTIFFFFNQQTESRSLTIAHNLGQQLQTTYLVLVSSLKGLPQHVQVQVTSVSQSAVEIYSSFRKTTAIGDMSSTIFVISRSQLSKIGDSMDNVMDYLVNNTPLNWLVGPFYPRVQRSMANGPKCNKQRTLKPEVEMQSVNEDR